MAATKTKRMTASEKQYREQARKKLRKEGILPPRKKPLNRKKYVEEALAAWEASEYGLEREYYALRYAASYITAGVHPTPEAVGVAKMIKAALEILKFEDELRVDGRSTYSVKEMYDRLKPIMDA